MKLLQTLLSWRHPVPRVAVATAAAAAGAGADATTVAGEEVQPGCGWFDSSHDLRAGLQVREHAANDAVCAELPLSMWLQLQQA